MMSRQDPTEQLGSLASPSLAGRSSEGAGRRLPLRWVWASYVVAGVALGVVAGISPSDFAALDKMLHVAPAASRYDMAHDDSPGAWAVVSAQRDETRFRGGGYRAWGVELMLQGQALVIEQSCAVDVPHVHEVSSEADGEIAVAIEAKRAVGSESTALVVAVADRHVVPEGGICTRCWDRFEVRVPLTTEWQSFVIPVSSMRQEGWGRPARREPDQSHLVDVAAIIREGGRQFDVSLRDLRIVRTTRESY
jgi:hypothetical protein